KVIRDKIMIEYDAIYPEYGFAKHKGYGTGLHLQSMERHGVCNIHRTTYAPVRELLIKQVRLSKGKMPAQRVKVVPN
ncbi:hypothetical protein HY793_04060, partial [Candidatus Desantisbacteria bacterium]|nr:hypothetical protein [Candidatus Desantisbacteria bacterium]